MLQIKSKAPLPRRFYIITGEFRDDIRDLYHGTHAHAVPDILSSRLRPSASGAGQEHCGKHFGVEVPMVYAAMSYDVALRYPIEATTMRVKESKSGVAGGSFVAEDSTPPLRAVIRCVALEQSQIWRRGNNQMGFKPKDLHITHVALYRAPSQHVHKHQILQRTHTVRSPNSIEEDLTQCRGMAAASRRLTSRALKKIRRSLAKPIPPETADRLVSWYKLAGTPEEEPSREDHNV